MSKRTADADWSRKLPTSIEVGKKKLRTLHDLRAHMLKLPEEVSEEHLWRAATQAVLKPPKTATCSEPKRLLYSAFAGWSSEKRACKPSRSRRRQSSTASIHDPRALAAGPGGARPHNPAAGQARAGLSVSQKGTMLVSHAAGDPEEEAAIALAREWIANGRDNETVGSAKTA